MSKDEKFIPLYQIIFNELKDKIVSGELQPNTPLPLQGELAKIYKTSEITSRRALMELVKEELIYRVKGKGTFVAERTGPSSDSGRTGQIHNVYFVHPRTNMQVFNHRFFSDMLSGIQRFCEENDIDFCIWDLGPDMALPDDDNAGYIILTHLPQAQEIPMHKLSQWKAENRKMVTVHFYYPHLRLPYVISDNLTGGYLSTQHLLALGHQRIGIILTGKSQLELNQEFSLRLQGYKLALSQHRIELNPQLVVTMDGDQENEAMGYEGFRQLTAMDNPPTAIFATSDMKAIGAMRAARDLGWDIPGRMSLIGYDNLIISSFLSPQLTTIDQNAGTLGYRAAEIVLFDYPNAQNDLVKDEIVPRLVVRGSTAEPVSGPAAR
ncbi:MAG: GntR family transcriptional regulator [Paenibacillus sp.]|nr:GntR family transcriptional regulator [Paenibacillus sp.]